MKRTSGGARRRDGPSRRPPPGPDHAAAARSGRDGRGDVAQPGAAGSAGAERTVLGVLVLVLATRVVASFPSSNWIWGIDTLRYWPLVGQVMLVALAGAGFVPWIGTRIGRALGAVGDRWERAGIAGDVVLSLAVAIVLFTLRDPLRFTGDFDLRVGQIYLPDAAARRLMSHAYPLDWLAGYHAPRFLHRLGMDAVSALQLVGAVTGALFTFAGSRLLGATGTRGAGLASAGIVVLGSGVLIHFAGYNKFGPLAASIAFAAAGAVRLARGRRGLGLLTAGTLGAILSHRSGYLLLPAFAWTWAHAFRHAGHGRRPAEFVVAMGLVATGTIALLGRTADLVLGFDRSVHLPGGAVAASRLATEASAAWLPIGDAMNAASFLSPLWLAGLAAAWAGRGRAPAAARRGSFSLVPVTVLALIPFVLLVIAVQPGRGWARDWDVAIGMGVVATLATAAALASCWRGGDRHTLAPCSTVTLSIAFAMWGVHASEPVALGRVENLLRARPSWSDATRAQTLDFLGARALNAGHAADAARFFERSIECGPNPRLFYQLGLALFADGDLDRARAEFLRAAGLNPTVPEPWLGLTRVALAQRDTVAAIRYLDSTLARDPQHVEARQARASLSQQTR